MEYKLKTVNGRVDALLESGKDLVKTEMSASAAQHILDTSRHIKSEIEGYPIHTEDGWYFAGEEIKRGKKTNG
jgi:hypothetical protein